ncbi:MAG: anti-sigma factor family protein [Terriglobia bacterium]
MKCEKLQLDIALYLEGDLPIRRARVLEAHLHSCRTCRIFAFELRALQATLKSLSRDADQGAALDRIRTRLMRTVASGPPSGRFPAHRYAAAAGVIVALAIGSFSLVRLRNGRTSLAQTTQVFRAPAPQRSSPLPKPKRAGAAPRRRMESRLLLASTARFIPARRLRHALLHAHYDPSARKAPPATYQTQSAALEQQPLGSFRQRIALASAPGKDLAITSNSPHQKPELKVKLITNDPNVVIYMIVD